MRTDEPILSIENLTVDFKSDGNITKAVDHISVTVNKGKTLGIVGESGSGKSVTSLSIMRLIQSPPGKISEGKILFSKDGKEQINILSLTEKEMRKISGN